MTPPPRAGQRDRRRAERRGRLAEAYAAVILTLKGYFIIARRFKSPAGEVDLIAKRGRLLVFVEVKARTTTAAAIEAVTPRAEKRIGAAAGLFLSRRRDLADCMVRYDIIAIAGWRARHIPDAWRHGP